jgi:hypothetical protein
MSETLTFTQVADVVAQLPPPERKRLAELILRGLAVEAQSETPPRRRFWCEVRGSVPYPLCGEDAQAWVSRTRHE